MRAGGEAGECALSGSGGIGGGSAQEVGGLRGQIGDGKSEQLIAVGGWKGLRCAVGIHCHGRAIFKPGIGAAAAGREGAGEYGAVSGDAGDGGGGGPEIGGRRGAG